MKISYPSSGFGCVYIFYTRQQYFLHNFRFFRQPSSCSLQDPTTLPNGLFRPATQPVFADHSVPGIGPDVNHQCYLVGCPIRRPQLWHHPHPNILGNGYGYRNGYKPRSQHYSPLPGRFAGAVALSPGYCGDGYRGFVQQRCQLFLLLTG